MDVGLRFSFGKNWQDFVLSSLTPEKVEQAREAYRELTQGIDHFGKTYLDIGYGQGLSLLFARELGAEVVGIDIDVDNLPAVEKIFSQYGDGRLPDLQVASILDKSFLEKAKQNNGRFDIVHSWGVLHHTGDMRQAIENSVELVKENGYLILALYNRHWSSPIWKIIKLLYNKVPPWVRNLFVRFFYPIIYVAKWLATKEDPRKKKRGMDFYYDVVDWVGGYPYEYISISKAIEIFKTLNLEVLRIIPAKVPTGCNEFVLQKMRA